MLQYEQFFRAILANSQSKELKIGFFDIYGLLVELYDKLENGFNKHSDYLLVEMEKLIQLLDTKSCFYLLLLFILISIIYFTVLFCFA